VVLKEGSEKKKALLHKHKTVMLVHRSEAIEKQKKGRLYYKLGENQGARK